MRSCETCRNRIGTTMLSLPGVHRGAPLSNQQNRAAQLRFVGDPLVIVEAALDPIDRHGAGLREQSHDLVRPAVRRPPQCFVLVRPRRRS